MLIDNTNFVIVDQFDNNLLYDPTFFDYLEEEDVVVPFVYDANCFTVFRTEEALQEIFDMWAETIKVMKYRAISWETVAKGEKIKMKTGLDNVSLI